MNHTYRLVWNRVQRIWVPVAESARARGKATRSATSRRPFKPLLLCALALAGAQVQGAPQQGQVPHGSATITQSGPAAATTTIKQDSQKAIINWRSFDVGAGESVQFVQPNASAIALNRVTGGQGRSQIDGKLTANGQVFVLNPNGVLFGQGAQVNVGGLVASTFKLSDQDFLDGNYVFRKEAGADPSAGVTNQGSLVAAEGGYVALLGPQVRNESGATISARRGQVLLAAGDSVTLSLGGGSLLGYKIDAATIDTLVANHGTIQADGGQVVLDARALKDSVARAVVNNTGLIEARTIDNSSGTIKLLGDMHSGVVRQAGTLDASAPAGGDGGFVETSAFKVETADSARVSTAAPQGRAGTWLIDPINYTIAESGGDIKPATLASNLDGGNVVIQTIADGSTVGGDISVNDAVNWGSANTLTLSAHHNINVNASISAQGGGRLVLRADSEGLGTSSKDGTVIFGAAGKVSTSHTDLYYNPDSYDAPTDFSSVAGNHTAWMLVNNVGRLQDISKNLAGNYALGGDIDARGFSFAPIGGAVAGAFEGNFDGLNHTIQNLKIDRSGSNEGVGLFGMIGPVAEVANVGLVNCSVNGNDNVGSLAGYNYGTIRNAHVTGEVTGEVTSAYWVGGLVGENHGTISGSSAAGTVVGNSGVGGLVGYNLGTISGSSAAGTVNSYWGAGGLVGYDSGGSIMGSYASSNVNGDINVGGLVGITLDTTITGSYATGVVSGASVNVGGLVGHVEASTISDSYATGAVNGASADAVGGLVGIFTDGSITNVYAAGAVSGGSDVGGLVGYAYPSVIIAGDAAYWDTETTGQSTSSGGGTGKTTAQLMDPATFAGWNIATTGGSAATWRIYADQTRPLLRSSLTPLTVTAGDISKTYDRQVVGALSNAQYSVAGADTSGQVFGTSDPYGGAVNVGTHAPVLWSDQYDISVGGGALTINPAIVTLSGISAANKIYDGNANATLNIGTPGLVGVVSGDNLTVGWTPGGVSGSFSDKNVGAGKTVSISGFSLGGGAVGNYVLQTPAVTADITARPLTVSGISAANKTYDGTTTATLDTGTHALAGKVAGDDLWLDQSLGGPIGAFADKNAGTGKTVNISGIALTGADAGNYLLTSSTAATTADIGKAPLNIVANHATVLATGAAYAGGNGVRYIGFVNGEDASVLGGTLGYSGTAQGARAPGRYTITPQGLASSNNYAITAIDGTLTLKVAADTIGTLSKSPDPNMPPPVESTSVRSVIATAAPSDGRFDECTAQSANTALAHVSIVACGMAMPPSMPTPQATAN